VDREGGDRFGSLNRRIGWASIFVGVATGSILGLWSFDGPVAVPEWLGAYDATARRLVRLGHIAFLGLGILDILLGAELARVRLTPAMKRTASRAMVFANVVLPLNLFAAGAWRPLKYALPLPVVGAIVAFAIVAWGVWSTRDA
jgi:hypothetical protein